MGRPAPAKLSTRRLDDLGETDVDALPAPGLVAMDGEDDLLARLEHRQGGGADLHGLVGRDVARLRGGEDAVDVDLDVLVVVDEELEARRRRPASGRVISRRSQTSGVSQVVPTTAPGVPFDAEAAGAFASIRGRRSRGWSSPSAGRRTVYRQSAGWRCDGGDDLGDLVGSRGSAAQWSILGGVAARPRLPDGGVGEHLDEDAADHGAGVHAVAFGVVGHVGVDERACGRSSGSGSRRSGRRSPRSRPRSSAIVALQTDQSVLVSLVRESSGTPKGCITFL